MPTATSAERTTLLIVVGELLDEDQEMALALGGGDPRFVRGPMS